jgi:hypothetical protein
LDYWLVWLGGAAALALGVLILPRLLRKSN